MRNLSQVALAQALKVDKQTVWRWEDGRAWPEYAALEAISKHLNIEIEQLFEGITGNSERPSITPKEALMVIAEALSAKPQADELSRLTQDPNVYEIALAAARGYAGETETVDKPMKGQLKKHSIP